MSEIIKSIYKLKEPGLEACKLFLKVCKERDINIFITETYRSMERQNYLYKKGASKCDGIKKISSHQSGLAWDIACRGNELYNHEILDKAGGIARELGIVWGGNWSSFIDKPHFEVSKNWRIPKTIDCYNLSSQKIYINGSYKDVESIVMDKVNFIKLRDLECSKFKVDYLNGTVFINGNEFKGSMIKKQDSSYIKIRDLELLGIGVIYNSKLKTIIINC